MTRKAISPRFAIKTFSNMIVGQALRLPALTAAPSSGRRSARPTNALHRTRYNTWPNCTGLPFSATISAITPSVSALISFITFIASIIQTTVSSVTSLPTSTNGDASGEAARKNVPTIGETISRKCDAPGGGAATVGGYVGEFVGPFCTTGALGAGIIEL